MVDTHGRQIPQDEPIAAAAEMLRAGRILAIKGLGGFHLACRADDEHVLGRLRGRKRRDAKPFAMMVANLAQAEALCELTDEARALLTSPIRPIVICPARPDAAPTVSCAGTRCCSPSSPRSWGNHRDSHPLPRAIR